MPLGALTIKSFGQFSVVTVTYFADGQKQYYIISPHGQLIDTLIDPKKLDKTLANKYADVAFLVVNWDEPKYKIEKNGMHIFLVKLRVTKQCLACELIGYSEVKFTFDKQGNLLGTDLIKSLGPQ